MVGPRCLALGGPSLQQQKLGLEHPSNAEELNRESDDSMTRASSTLPCGAMTKETTTVASMRCRKHHWVFRDSG
jgi:hypothetical protein